MSVINPPERKLAKRTSVQWQTPLRSVTAFYGIRLSHALCFSFKIKNI
jgi:hypothetical protein